MIRAILILSVLSLPSRIYTLRGTVKNLLPSGWVTQHDYNDTYRGSPNKKTIGFAKRRIEAKNNAIHKMKIGIRKKFLGENDSNCNKSLDFQICLKINETIKKFKIIVTSYTRTDRVVITFRLHKINLKKLIRTYFNLFEKKKQVRLELALLSHIHDLTWKLICFDKCNKIDMIRFTDKFNYLKSMYINKRLSFLSLSDYQRPNKCRYEIHNVESITYIITNPRKKSFLFFNGLETMYLNNMNLHNILIHHEKDERGIVKFIHNALW